MTDLLIINHPEDGALVVDSRLIAQELAVTHEAFYKTIKKYEKETEQAFGGLRFQIGVPDKPTGNPPQFVYLTEDQATFLMTLSRNTPEVVRCKVLLVTQFSQAKKLLAEQGYQHFRRWLREEYIEKWLPQYLANTYGKRAVLQIYQEQDKLNSYILEITEEKRASSEQEKKHQVFLAAREILENRSLQGN